MRLIPEKDFPELQRHPESGVWYVRKYVNGKERLKSTKASMEKLALALLDCEHSLQFPEEKAWQRGSIEVAREAIAAVKAEGNWPLEIDT